MRDLRVDEELKGEDLHLAVEEKWHRVKYSVESNKALENITTWKYHDFKILWASYPVAFGEMETMFDTFL